MQSISRNFLNWDRTCSKYDFFFFFQFCSSYKCVLLGDNPFLCILFALPFRFMVSNSCVYIKMLRHNSFDIFGSTFSGLRKTVSDVEGNAGMFRIFYCSNFSLSLFAQEQHRFLINVICCFLPFQVKEISFMILT